jgi:hypothetical protein
LARPSASCVASPGIGKMSGLSYIIGPQRKN